jgi:hypothetical protein
MADPIDVPTPPPGYLSTPSMAPLTVDGLPLADATGALLSTPSTPGQQQAESQRFWSTPPRPLGDPHDEVLLIKLAKPTQINYIELDLPHFPHHFYIFYWEPTKKAWLEIQAQPNKYSVRFYIDGAVPQVIGPANVMQAHQHPSHYGADHWVHYSADLVPFTATKLRLSGNRNFGSTKGGPVDVHGRPANYALGVRNLDFGTRILSRQDVPLTDRDPDIITERESFTVVTDIAGSPVELSMRENRASDLILGRMWKCEPQPFSYAVIPLYVDARDPQGNPQVIDRFYLNPITSGVRVNLYYSETPPDASDFDAEDTPLTFPLTRQAGQGIPTLDSDGLAFPDKIAYIDVSNQAMQWDPTKPFWVGVDIQPQFNSSATTDHVIWDAGPFSLLWRDQEWTLAFDDGYLTLPPYDHQINQHLQFVIGYDGQQVSFYSPEGGVILLPATIEDLTVAAIRFGAEEGFTDEDLIITGDYRLHSFVLKKESLPFISGPGGIEVPQPVADFISDPAAYVLKAPYAGQDTGSTKNSLLRFGLQFVMGTPENGINPWGFVGGPGNVYDDVVWTPINRDFTLAKGFMQFNPTRAACFKFEFTNLQPQPYEVYQPKTTKVQVFPSAIVASSTPTQPSGDSGAGSSGLIANNDAVHPLQYADAIRLRYTAPTQTALGGLPPTEAMYATDPATAQRLAQYGGMYHFQPWQPPATTPRFNTTASHYYETVDVVQNSRVAYFVALSGLSMYRVDYATDDDTDQYLETFGDLLHVASSNWPWQPGALSTPADIAAPVTATSVVFPSRRKVRGIQFASQQSSAVQLLIDPDFDDPELRAWSPVGDIAPLELSEDFNASVGSTVKIQRESGIDNWADMEANWASWDELEASIAGDTRPNWNDLEVDTEGGTVGGVVYGANVETTKAGRLYAAARVYTDVPLTEPLVLQILDESGTVLAEAERTVTGGHVTEWYVGYTIGEGGGTESETWDEIEASNASPSLPNYNDLAIQTWDTVDTTELPLGTKVSVQLLQRGSTTDTFFVDNLSLFEDAIVWEFSNDGGANWWPVYDIRNDPHGVFIFPDPTTPTISTGTQLMWRVTGYRPYLHVNSLAIRPWYGSLPLGVPHREPGMGGPNMNPTDHFPPVEQDPRWQAWHEPVPQDWWFVQRQLLLLGRPYIPVDTSTPSSRANVWLNPDGLVPIPPVTPPDDSPPPDEEHIGPEIYIDIYGDPYTGTYGPEAGGGTYTDNYGNGTY